MSSRNELSFFGASEWRCRCGGDLIPRKVAALYMGSRFEVELPACERCGFILVPEDLALGKMLEVERILEDK
jgi:hypothetical protein